MNSEAPDFEYYIEEIEKENLGMILG